MRIVFLIFLGLLRIHFLLQAQGVNCNSQWFEGEGTHYGGVAGGAGGHCGIPVATGDMYHAALNHTQYASSQACGACVRVIGPKGEATLKIVDECPECKFGDIDMTTTVFPQLAQMKDGRIKIKWQYVPCPQTAGISVVFAPGSGSYYFKAQFRDFLYPLLKVEYKKSDGTFKEIPRQVYNYFVVEGGIDDDPLRTGPYYFRLTALTGQTLDLPTITFDTSAVVETSYQFSAIPCPDCAGVADGTAQIDYCEVCSGGTTGILPNTACKKDCNDYWDGAAYVDTCGRCVAGTTGATPCGNDCNGQPGGMAYVDKCGNCVAGTTGLTACEKDCDKKWGGRAFLDSCGFCAGGNTGAVPVLDKNVCLVSSLLDYKLESDKQAYPNPFENEIIIRAEENVKMQITDISGKVVWQGSIIDGRLNTDFLPRGLYFFTLVSPTGANTVKRVKK